MSTSAYSKAMTSSLKPCYVLLNRNLPDQGYKTSKINNFPMLDMKNFVVSSDGKKILDCEVLPSVIYNKTDYGLRKKKKITYTDDIESTEKEDSVSEFSDDGSSLDDEEMSTGQKRIKRNHYLSNTSPKKLSCLLCVDKSFNSHSSYLKHKLSHESNPYRCILCNMSFPHRQSLILHMKRYHPEIEPFLCEYQHCEENFKTRRLLEIHQKKHWKYMCRYCKKLFVRKHQMRRHVLKIH